MALVPLIKDYPCCKKFKDPFLPNVWRYVEGRMNGHVMGNASQVMKLATVNVKKGDGNVKEATNALMGNGFAMGILIVRMVETKKIVQIAELTKHGFVMETQFAKTIPYHVMVIVRISQPIVVARDVFRVTFLVKASV